MTHNLQQPENRSLRPQWVLTKSERVQMHQDLRPEKKKRVFKCQQHKLLVVFCPVRGTVVWSCFLSWCNSGMLESSLWSQISLSTVRWLVSPQPAPPLTAKQEMISPVRPSFSSSSWCLLMLSSALWADPICGDFALFGSFKRIVVYYSYN